MIRDLFRDSLNDLFAYRKSKNGLKKGRGIHFTTFFYSTQIISNGQCLPASKYPMFDMGNLSRTC